MKGLKLIPICFLFVACFESERLSGDFGKRPQLQAQQQLPLNIHSTPLYQNAKNYIYSQDQLSDAEKSSLLELLKLPNFKNGISFIQNVESEKIALFVKNFSFQFDETTELLAELGISPDQIHNMSVTRYKNSIEIQSKSGYITNWLVVLYADSDGRIAVYKFILGSVCYENCEQETYKYNIQVYQNFLSVNQCTQQLNDQSLNIKLFKSGYCHSTNPLQRDNKAVNLQKICDQEYGYLSHFTNNEHMSSLLFAHKQNIEIPSSLHWQQNDLQDYSVYLIVHSDPDKFLNYTSQFKRLKKLQPLSFSKEICNQL